MSEQNTEDPLGAMSSGAQAFIDDVRDLDGPSHADRDRVKRALVATLASGAGLAATTVASSTAAASGTIASGAVAGTTAAVGLSLGVKIAAVALVAAALGGTALVVTQRQTEMVAPAAPEAPPTFAEPVPLRDPEPAPSTVEDEPQPIEEVTIEEEPPPEETASETRATAEPAPHRRVPATRREVAVADSTLAEEIRVIRRAQRALQSGDPDTALLHLNDHAGRFEAGVLAEEREAARIVALCQAGRAEESRALAQRFIRERPTSPHRARVLGACPAR